VRSWALPRLGSFHDRGTRPDDTVVQASEAPFQDSGVFIRGFPPKKKTTRQADFASRAETLVSG
jgi:hypothetical protein